VCKGALLSSGSFGRTRGRHLPFCVIIWECAKCARDVQVHLHGPGGRRLTPGAPSWARAAPGRYQGTMQRNERCGLSGRPTRRREKSGRRQPGSGGVKERCISGDARATRRALVVLAAIGGHVTPQPNHNWCGCVVCDCARRCAALGKGAFLCKVVMIMVGAVGA
jgi:hypothetical protein